MKEAKQIKQPKRPDVTIDDAAISRYDNVVLFPEKLARVNEMLKTAKLPERRPRQ